MPLVALVIITISCLASEESSQEVDISGAVTGMYEWKNRAIVLTIDTAQGIRQVEVGANVSIADSGADSGQNAKSRPVTFLGKFVNIRARQPVDRAKLLLASRVIVEPNRPEVTGQFPRSLSSPELSPVTSSWLLSWATAGEIEGVITDVDQSTPAASLTIRSGFGDVVELNLAADIRIVDDGSNLSLDRLPGMEANVKFDVLRREAVLIEIDRFPRNKSFTSGVVTSTPANQFRQITITREEFPILGDLHPSGVPSFGPTLTLYLLDDTVIYKDGKLAKASDVAFGDFVRPNTSFNPGLLTVTHLELISPRVPITGPVVGIDASLENVQIILDTSCCGVLSVLANQDTKISSGTGSRTIELGDEITVGSHYNPMTGRSFELNVIGGN